MVQLQGLPLPDGMIQPAIGIDLIDVARAAAKLEKVGYSSDQASFFVSGVLQQFRDKMERLTDDFLAEYRTREVK
jgi:hypothetical protein